MRESSGVEGGAAGGAVGAVGVVLADRMNVWMGWTVQLWWIQVEMEGRWRNDLSYYSILI